ncbi:paraquat-inducible protein A [Fulvimonas sp. R45]|uniref:paraquat-inducible protein A n=1 Tax=Fulvimonas sp. R45 TaxID=3045937 RepID=UPI0026605633|nr:paraquat-inducible protein A [Fulvimonas sp. R45]MDO1528087.1 paraquat-inducible protein A [Fulvimonas sp. R45]
MSVPSHAGAAERAEVPAPLLICEHCDTVYRRRPLARGETARCARCGALLERHHGLGPGTMLALVLTALVVFVEANAWPIVTLGLNGEQVSTTLWGMITFMWKQDAQVVSVLAAGTLFFFPLAKILLLGWVLLFARAGRRAPGFRPVMVALHYLHPWTMSEVFVLGVLVSIVKAHLYFDVVPDPGVFAYAVLVVLITVFAGIDLRRLWELVPERPA